MLKINFEDYTALSRDYDFIPLWTEIVGDMITPVQIYQKIRSLSPYSYLLESVQQDEKLGRYSFIGFDPLIKFQSKRDKIHLSQENMKEREFSGNPFDQLFNLIEEFKLAKIEQLRPYFGAFVGYFGYDTVRHIEDIPDNNPDDLELPDSFFILPKVIILFDHLYQSVRLILITPAGAREEYEQAKKKMEEILNLIFSSATATKIPYLKNFPGKEPEFSSNISKSTFLDAVEKAKHYIKEGDIFQVVLSQRFEMNYSNDPFSVYRALRRINPSPYLFFLDFDDFQVAGSSPEILVKKEGETLTLRPIAGTRKRGRTPQEDEELKNDLLQDPKEIAEHMMLVDLGRNDLGRISKFGTVNPTSFKQVENYSHVMHIVTNLVSKIKEGISAANVITSTFPAGTLSGAPKIRAMEIIDELEVVRRGFYAGTVANIDFINNIDACIAIRSVVLKNEKAYIQAGAGIVADSVPEKEYEECVNKAKAVMKAIQVAEGE